MPAVAPIVAGVAAAASSALAGKAFILGSVTLTAIATGVGTAALGFLSSALQPKPPEFDPTAFSPAARQQTTAGRTQQVRQPITARRVVYGEKRVSGPLIYAGTSNDNEYLHLVIALASHEVQEIGTVYFNDTPIHSDNLDGFGNVVGGLYGGVARIKKHLGTDAQTADSDLVAEVAEWTTDHRLRGIAYIYCRLQFDRDKYPTGIPSISAFVKGRKVLDTRDSVTRWSPNPALIVRDYLTNADYGYGAKAAEIDDTFINAAANACDEMVTVSDRVSTITAVSSGRLVLGNEETLFLQTGDEVLYTASGSPHGGLTSGNSYYVIVNKIQETPTVQLASSYGNAILGSPVTITTESAGTHTLTKRKEPRYTCNGVVETDATPAQVMEDLLSSMAGRAVNSGANWKVRAGVYESPTIELDESDLRGPIRVQTRHPRRDRFNAVKGVYASPINLDVPTDYPAVTNATYKTADNGERLWLERPMPFTSRPHTAQRLAKIELERHRQEITVEYPAKLSAIRLRAGSTVHISNARFGWSLKAFEVVDCTLVVDQDDTGAPTLGVDLTLRETASTVFDWANGEETSVDPAPNTSLPDPFTVSAPTSLAVSSAQIKTATGDETYRATVTWDAPSDSFVSVRGEHEIQWRESADTDWQPSWRVSGDQTAAFIYQLERGVSYDVRVRAINSIGVRSSWSSLFGFTVTSPAGATALLDYGEFSTAHSEALDYGEFSTAHTQALDYGEFA